MSELTRSNPVEIGFIADEVVDHIPDVVGMMEKRFLTEDETDTRNRQSVSYETDSGACQSHPRTTRPN